MNKTIFKRFKLSFC